MSKAYLTIDDSPSARTDDLTDALVARKIPALLFCRGDQIVIFGQMRIPESVGGPGNAIVFRGPDLDVEFRNVDWVKLPSLREQMKAAKSGK